MRIFKKHYPMDKSNECCALGGREVVVCPAILLVDNTNHKSNNTPEGEP